MNLFQNTRVGSFKNAAKTAEPDSLNWERKLFFKIQVEIMEKDFYQILTAERIVIAPAATILESQQQFHGNAGF